MGNHMTWSKVWTADPHGERPQRQKSRSWAWSESGGHLSPEVSFPFPGSTPGMWTVPGMTRSRTYWPSSIIGRYSTKPARWSGRAVSCWSSMGTSMARTLASSGTGRERVSLRLGEVSVTPLPAPHPILGTSMVKFLSRGQSSPKSVELQLKCLRIWFFLHNC